jgi:indole-3-glycerol phosphate synthase
MSTKLEEILASTRRRIDEARRERPLGEIARDAERVAAPTRGFRNTLLAAAEKGVAIIAELKKASPSKGLLRGTFHVGGLAMQMEKFGASALSVLTEEEFFLGSPQHLLEASAATRLPCLRKDFILDEYQVYESRLLRADAILLIAAILDDAQLSSLYAKAKSVGLDVVCEVHDEDELSRVMAIDADIVGVNSRDLHTLEVDTAVHHRLAPLLPKGALRVAESGISSGEEIRKMRIGSGYQAFLVGESLMKAEDPALLLSQLMGQAKATSSP